MRVLLLLALFLRFVPVPLPMEGDAHCGVAHATAPAAGHEGAHAHHDAPASAAGEHEECPHCPPTDCAKHDHCPQPGLLVIATAAHGHLATAPINAPHPIVIEALASRVDPPPVRPPLLPLA